MKMLQFTGGDTMPFIGLGTWKAEPGDVYRAVKEALKIGYRHIDCALIYGNEAEIGKAIRESIDEKIVTREDLWITSKLWNDAHAPQDVKSGLETTLGDLQLDYLDLYLIHWPVVHKKGVVFPENASGFVALEDEPIVGTWKVMEELVDAGLCKHIGVSNFSIKKLKALLEVARIKPEMNQIELHPYLQQAKMVKFCSAKGIHLTAYAPLGSGDRPAQFKADNEPVLMVDPIITALAKKYSATPAQILISWSIMRDTVVIPKSSNPERLKQNLDSAALTLSDDDMQEMAKLEKNFRYVAGDFWETPGGPYTLSNLWDE
ncbi:aldo/keto reductase [Desulforhopalus sp. 52FAK]